MATDGLIASTPSLPIGGCITCPLVSIKTLRTQWQPESGLTILDTEFDCAQTVLSVWAALGDLACAAKPVHIIALSGHIPPCEAIRHLASVGQQALVDRLCAALPPDVPGYHRLLLDDGKIVLTLILGEERNALTTLVGRIDVFYIKSQIASDLTPHCAKQLGQLANVRAQLFCDRQREGLPEILQAGGFVTDDSAMQTSPQVVSARYLPRWAVHGRHVVPALARRAIVIGAGLAGTAIAERLTVRGWHVTVFEASDAPAQVASGNLAGVYMPMISRDDNPASRLNRAGYFFAQQLWAQLGGVGEAITGEACGVLQVARDTEQQTAFMQAALKWQYPATFAKWLDSAQASRQLGMATRGGWLFPQAGWLQPASVCAAMLRACGSHAGQLTLRCATRVVRLQRDEGQWLALDDNGNILADAPTVILANGMAALDFAAASALPLAAMRGQVTHVPAALLPELPFVLCGDGYMTRPCDGIVSVGATYGQDTGQGVCLDDHLENRGKLMQLLPGLDPLPDVRGATGRVGVRCVTPDRMPLVGALPASSAVIGKGVADKGLTAMPRVAGLYGLLGYASRGLIMAPLAAEILACQLTGEPMPVGRALLDAVDPSRFVLRNIRKTEQED